MNREYQNSYHPVLRLPNRPLPHNLQIRPHDNLPPRPPIKNRENDNFGHPQHRATTPNPHPQAQLTLRISRFLQEKQAFCKLHCSRVCRLLENVLDLHGDGEGDSGVILWVLVRGYGEDEVGCRELLEGGREDEEGGDEYDDCVWQGCAQS